MNSEPFFSTGGTLHFSSPSYVERQADKEIYQSLVDGEFCYILTARQMGKSSLMIRTAHRLREEGIYVAALDFTAIGLNLTAEQWYDGLLARLGRQMNLEDQLEDFWMDNERLGPCQRFFNAIQDVTLPQALSDAKEGGDVKTSRMVIFVDEVDVVQSLPFSTDEFFGAIKECYNRRVSEPSLKGLTFCLLGVAMPYELITNPKTTPFNIGVKIPLADFTPSEAAGLKKGLNAGESADALMERILYWTSGHPYLTQRLGKAVHEWHQNPPGDLKHSSAGGVVDRLCETLFFNSRARETDDNLLFVRERLLRSGRDLMRLMDLYEQILQGGMIREDDQNDLINQLRLSGIVKEEGGCLRVRNRVYERVFNLEWVRTVKPLAELEKENGERIQLKGSCSFGRAESNEVILPDVKVSRKHAFLQKHGNSECWLTDLSSRNGIYLNGTRITRAVLLRDQDRIQIGPFQLIFHQHNAPRIHEDSQSTVNKTDLFDRTQYG